MIKKLWYDEKYNCILEIDCHIDNHIESFSIKFDTTMDRDKVVKDILKKEGIKLESKLTQLVAIQKEQAAKAPKSPVICLPQRKFDIDEELVKGFLKSNYAEYSNYEIDKDIDIKEELKKITIKDYNQVFS